MEATSEQRTAFGSALAYAIKAEKKRRKGALTDAVIADALRERGHRLDPSNLSAWRSGKGEPARVVTFALEEILQQKPGRLSRHLGYLPPQAKPPRSLEDVLAADATLTQAQRDLLLDLYRLSQQQTAERRARRG